MFTAASLVQRVLGGAAGPVDTTAVDISSAAEHAWATINQLFNKLVCEMKAFHHRKFQFILVWSQ
jgi:hypothetical protein